MATTKDPALAIPAQQEGETPFVSFFAGVCPRKMTREQVPRPFGGGVRGGEIRVGNRPHLIHRAIACSPQ